MTGDLIESANFFVLIIALFVGWRHIKWRRRSDINEVTRWIICCWMFVFAGVGISKGWFASSRFFHDPGEKWSLAMYEWRWLLVMLTAGLIGWGAVSFTSMIDDDPRWKQVFVFGAAAVVAFGMGFY
jgi:hypothetical protein